jgi:hypothetical protein
MTRTLVQGRSGCGPGSDVPITQHFRGSVHGIQVGQVPKSLYAKIRCGVRVSDFSRGTLFYLDHLDRPDQGLEIKGISGPGAVAGPGPPWIDDRAWIARWRDAGPTLAERKPVLEAWLATAPPQPLPRWLAALELARIARNHGIKVEVTP